MRKRISTLLLFVALIYACNSCRRATHATARGPAVDDIVGKWRLVRADGKPPTEWWIKSLEIGLTADGKWTSQIEGEGYLGGMKATGGGTWSLADGKITYTNGVKNGTSTIRLESGRLVVDPDFFMSIRKKSPEPISAEYER
ncbi:MAG TPA: hypothetical protein VFE47_20355 [Tepidisphaeraceae bacterium]|jgi:hypothetical protein|nr:hypothetical protein [Tepidisphaeraceae bacterium]